MWEILSYLLLQKREKCDIIIIDGEEIERFK
jgi:hypothetical protein